MRSWPDSNLELLNKVSLVMVCALALYCAIYVASKVWRKMGGREMLPNHPLDRSGP